MTYNKRVQFPELLQKEESEIPTSAPTIGQMKRSEHIQMNENIRKLPLLKQAVENWQNKMYEYDVNVELDEKLSVEGCCHTIKLYDRGGNPNR